MVDLTDRSTNSYGYYTITDATIGDALFDTWINGGIVYMIGKNEYSNSRTRLAKVSSVDVYPSANRIRISAVYGISGNTTAQTFVADVTTSSPKSYNLT